MLIKNFLILVSFIVVISCEHLFENLLQRRAKPIRWMWNNQLTKPPEVQRQRRFLPDETVVKWWREMTPQRNSRTNAIGTKESLSLFEEAYFRRPYHTDNYKTPRLTETSKGENKNSIISNRTQSLREGSIFKQNHQSSYGSLQSPPIEPFEKSNAFDIGNYLAPTENTLFSGQYFPPSFETFQNIPQQRERKNEDFRTLRNEDNIGHSSPQHDIDSEFLREAIIHERHKPSKFEIQSAAERLRNSIKSEKDFQRSMSSVEYVVPSVEHVIPQVEYADNKSDLTEPQIHHVVPNVEYVTPTIEFVEPELDYSSDQFNETDDLESTIDDENPLTDEDIIIIEEDWPEERPLETYKGEGARYQIIGLRREQIRVRRNRRTKYLGEPDTDYPTLEALPVLQFHCRDYLPGYYVDITTRCQVFHICHEDGQRSSFLCPVGTVFNQEYLVCDWWYNVDCESSLRYYTSDSLQAYSTTTNNKQILSRSVVSKENFPIQQELISSQPTFTISHNINRDLNERNSNSRLENLPKKLTHYPVGYGILLREYMKNSRSNNNDARWHSHQNDLKQIDNERTNSNGKDVQHALTLNNKGNHDVINQNYKLDNYRKHTLSDGSSSQTPTRKYKSKENENRSVRYESESETKHYKPNTQKPLNPTSYQNFTKPSNVLHASFHQEALPLDKIKKEELIRVKPKVTHKQTIRENNPKIIQENHPLNQNAKKKSSDISKYQFIINPKEAIIPASRQYPVLKHLKSNNSAIKFRHAESIIKHIKPRTNTKEIPANGNISWTNSKDRNKHRNYNSTVREQKDYIALNSNPNVFQAPRSTQNHQYGERLSIKSRSLPRENKNSFVLNGTKYGNIRDLETAIFSTLTMKKPQNHLYYGTDQLESSQSKNNYTFESVPSNIQNKHNFANVNKASDIFIRNYRTEKEKNISQTKSFYTKKDKENKFLTDKRKITISVQIERKEIVTKDLNQNISLNKNISDMEKTPITLKTKGNRYDTQRANHSPLYIIKPASKYSNGNSTNMNKTQMQKLKSTTRTRFQNGTKINNTYGGYSVVKVLGNSLMASHDHKNRAMKIPKDFKLQPNRTISKKLYIISD